MSKLTRSNIAYDLNVSPHEYLVAYDTYEIRFIFSSELYKRKFAEKLQENRQRINDSLQNRFGLKVDFHLLADLKLYTTIEKRGFLIYQNGDKIECPSLVILDGNNLIMTS